jgi:hypothetical protein
MPAQDNTGRRSKLVSAASDRLAQLRRSKMQERLQQRCSGLGESGEFTGADVMMCPFAPLRYLQFPTRQGPLIKLMRPCDTPTREAIFVRMVAAGAHHRGIPPHRGSEHRPFFSAPVSRAWSSLALWGNRLTEWGVASRLPAWTMATERQAGRGQSNAT